MEHNTSNEKEIIVDIEIGQEANVETGPTPSNKWGKKSLNKLVSGALSFKGLVDDAPTSTVEFPNETTRLLANELSQGVVPEKKKNGKVKKNSKPPRPPQGPSLDAADMRLIKEISNIAMKKRERMEQIKTLKKIKAAKMTSSSSSSSSLTSSGSTIWAMVITVLFFLVLLHQGLGSSTSSYMKVAVAPQAAPETTGSLTPVQFYETVMSNDGAAPSFMPPKFMR